MHNRSGFPVKNVVYAVFVLLLLYMVYIYNSSRTSLMEVEMTASRFRQESEERAAEIQGLLQSKDKQTEACENEKHELNNRIKSINQQHSMLESQYKEMEADFIKQKQDMDNLRAEASAAESQHAQEFLGLKQQKELEISELKDQVANIQRQNEELLGNVQSLNQKLVYAQIPGMDKRAAGLGAQADILGQGKVYNNAALANSVLGKGDEGDKKENLDQLNAQHQMVAPNNEANNNNVLGDSKDDQDFGDLGKGDDIDQGLGGNVVPNDPNHRQILEPNLNDYDENKDRRGDLDTGLKADDRLHDDQMQEEEEEEEGQEEDEENEDGMDVGQKQPLNLDQIDVPNRGGMIDGDQGNQAVVQQLPPVMGMKNDLNKDGNGGDAAERRDIQPVAPAL